MKAASAVVYVVLIVKERVTISVTDGGNLNSFMGGVNR
jgi:hypothetical protein